MGRVKLQIKKLESTNSRQATYTKRKHGIMKKAHELSVLCDIEVILLMFSPTGKPSLCKSKHSIEEVIAKFAQLTPQERTKRKLESLEALKKMFKKLDHDVNIPEFLGPSSQTVEDLANQSSLLQNQISQVHTRLSYWTNPEKINSLQHLEQLENSLKESLDRIRLHKEHLGKQQQLMSIECSRQLQSQMHMPFKFGVEQQFSPLPWFPRNENQPIALPEDPTQFPHRNAECSASSSFGSYSGLLATGGSSELSNYCQESGLNGLLHELSGTASLKLQLSGNYPYVPFNPNWPNETKFQPPAEMNVQQNPVPCQVDGSFEAPKFGYDTNSCGWTSTSGLFPITRFSEHLYAKGKLCAMKSASTRIKTEKSISNRN